MSQTYPKDIYTEPDADPHTLANLGRAPRWQASGKEKWGQT